MQNVGGRYCAGECHAQYEADCQSSKWQKAIMADKQQVQRSSGYVLGGVSPLGQKRPLATFIDESAQLFERIHVSAGRRGLEIELAPEDLATLTLGRFVALRLK